MHFLMNMLDSEPMKYARVGVSIKKVFDGRTNDIKQEKSWNKHINVLLDKKKYSINKKVYKNTHIKGGWLKSFNKNIKNEINKSTNIKLNLLTKSQNEK